MAVNKDLRKKAEELGVSVDPRWSDATIQQKIDEKEADKEVMGKGGFIPGSSVEDNAGPSKEALAGAAVYDGKVLPTEATPKAVKAGGAALDEKSRLIAKALQLLVEVDDKWDEARLRGEIQFAREGRADLQVKGAIPPAEICAVDYDPATKADKQGKIPGVVAPQTVDIPGVTIAGQPAVAIAGPTGGAVAKTAVVPATK